MNEYGMKGGPKATAKIDVEGTNYDLPVYAGSVGPDVVDISKFYGQSGRFTYDPGMEVSDTRLQAVARDHDKSFRARFPMLPDVTMDYRWGGRLCLSWNGVPAFGEIEEGLFSACCQNGLGTSKGTLAGMLAAELATQSNSPLVAKILACEAPKRLPPEPLAWLGANARMRWGEWKAGREL